MTSYWLVKSEPEAYPLSQLRLDRKTQWTGVRNYQARNFLVEMKVGDLVIFYHSGTDNPAAVGTARVLKIAYPDPTQFDKRSDFYDSKSSPDKPRWMAPDLGFDSMFVREVTIAEMRAIEELKGLLLLQRGSRLSVNPVTKSQFSTILRLGTSKD